MNEIFWIIIISTLIKCVLVGSDFSFYYWIRDGKKYINWYFSREKYHE